MVNADDHTEIIIHSDTKHYMQDQESGLPITKSGRCALAAGPGEMPADNVGQHKHWQTRRHFWPAAP